MFHPPTKVLLFFKLAYATRIHFFLQDHLEEHSGTAHVLFKDSYTNTFNLEKYITM